MGLQSHIEHNILQSHFEHNILYTYKNKYTQI